MASQKSSVWKHFTRNGREEKATCKLCLKPIQCKGGSTSALKRHIKTVHKIESDDESAEQPGSSRKTPTTNQSILSFTKRKTLDEIISRLAAEDGLTIRQITRSKFIRESLSSRGFESPKSENTTMRMIINFAKAKELEMKQELKVENAKYSLTFDEWTSSRSRRYLNVNLHNSNQKCFNLGLVRIYGSCDSLKTKQLLTTKLENFGIFWSDIIATTCDGASVNLKFGRESESEIIICINHSIHLAVLDAIIKRKTSKIHTNVASSNNGSDTDDESNIDSAEESTDDENIEIDYNDDKLHNCIEATRSIVKFFKNSPVRNTCLQNYVKEKFNKELILVLDCKTRWNSILNMVERFIILFDCVKLALKDLNHLQKIFEIDLELLKDFRDALSPIKLAVEALGRDDATLITAETVIVFMFNKIEILNSNIGRKLLDALKLRIIDRRNVNLTSLTHYLRDPSSWNKHADTLPYSTKSQVLEYGGKLFRRLFNVTSTTETADASTMEFYDGSVQLSMSEELDLAIKTASSQQSKQTLQSNNLFKKECSMFEFSGERTNNLENLFKALLTISPTSTDAERVFSIAGNICNKTRTRLGDEAMNALVFLKHFLLRQ